MWNRTPGRHVAVHYSTAAPCKLRSCLFDFELICEVFTLEIDKTNSLFVKLVTLYKNDQFQRFSSITTSDQRVVGQFLHFDIFTHNQIISVFGYVHIWLPLVSNFTLPKELWFNKLWWQFS